MHRHGKIPFWHKERHSARRPLLVKRQAILAAVRAHFANEGFLEVMTNALQISPGLETHLHAFETALVHPDGAQQAYYLHTSPEFAMKKLLSAGEEKIFSLAHVFRNREVSALHVAEFIMCEWYRAQAPLDTVMAECIAIVRLAAQGAGAAQFSWRGRRCDPHAPVERLSVRAAFLRHGGLDLYDFLDAAGAPLREPFLRAAATLGLHLSADDTWSDLFSRILCEKVEPRLGLGQLTLLCDYPSCEAALARVRAQDPRVCERCELYACGIELANGFGELTDPSVQRARFEATRAEQRRIYGRAYPLDEDFLAALSSMPEASGCALGLERLIMLAVGAKSVAEVQWTHL